MYNPAANVGQQNDDQADGGANDNADNPDADDQQAGDDGQDGGDKNDENGKSQTANDISGYIEGKTEFRFPL